MLFSIKCIFVIYEIIAYKQICVNESNIFRHVSWSWCSIRKEYFFHEIDPFLYHINGIKNRHFFTALQAGSNAVFVYHFQDLFPKGFVEIDYK